MKNYIFDRLPEDEQQLLKEAEKAMANAYNPYSKFSVGAALLSLDGKIITGSNYENAAYGPTICAERSALVKANSEGIRKFSKIAIIGKGKKGPTVGVTAPCGTCRQMLFEASQISKKDIWVIMANTNMTVIIKARISTLLPLAFGPDDLEIDVSKF
ncbi:MAG: cytidine deaminase [Candidatus Paceibacterota bacterium]|jgi:cytidine deaminase